MLFYVVTGRWNFETLVYFQRTETFACGFADSNLSLVYIFPVFGVDSYSSCYRYALHLLMLLARTPSRLSSGWSC